MIIDKKLDQLNTMYPSHGWLLHNEKLILPSFVQYSSIYGYSFGKNTITIDGKKYNLDSGQYFGLSVKKTAKIHALDRLFLVARLGYQVPNVIGWIEEKGRLSYIDGCSDSILVYPARLGDGSLNLLYFPPGINQSFHRHPSIRIGCIISGRGYSSFGEGSTVEELPLIEGNVFCLLEQERHRFRTEKSPMLIAAFHPDGDWGPTDHNHTMLNRTYVDK